MVNDTGVIRARRFFVVNKELPLAAETVRERAAEHLLAGITQAVFGLQFKMEEIQALIQRTVRRTQQRRLPFPQDRCLRTLHEDAVVISEIKARTGERRRTAQAEQKRKGFARAGIAQRRLAFVRQEPDIARSPLFNVKKAVQVRPSQPSRRFKRQIFSAYSVMLRSAEKIPALAMFVSAMRFQRVRSS